MITLTVTMNVRPEKYREMLITLRELTSFMRQEKNFIEARVLINDGQPDTVSFVQMWGTQEAVDAYMQSYYFEVLRGGMKILTNSWDIKLCESDNSIEYTQHPAHPLVMAAM